MSRTEKMERPKSVERSKTSWLKRLLWGGAFLLLFTAFILVSLRVFITTSAGARFIEKQINSRGFGPIESMEVSGLSGDPLKSLTIESLTLRDKQGVWLKAQNLRLDWKPLQYLRSHLWIDRISVQSTSVLRQPVLNPSKTDSELPKVTVKEFEVASLKLEESVIGRYTDLKVAGKFFVEDNLAIQSELKATDNVGDPDRLVLNFDRQPQGQMEGFFEVQGQAGGVMSTLLKAPAGQGVTGEGRLGGNVKSGEGYLRLNFGDNQIASTDLIWTETALKADTFLNIAPWPELDSLETALGAKIEARMQMQREAENSPFVITAMAPGVSFKAEGMRPDIKGKTAKNWYPDSVDMELNLARPDLILPFPEAVFMEGVEAKGKVKIKAPYAFDGQIAVQGLSTPQINMGRTRGPLKLSQDSNGTISIQTDIEAENIRLRSQQPIEIGTSGNAKVKAIFDSQKRRLSFESFIVKSGPSTVSSSGYLTLDRNQTDLKGSLSVKTRPLGSIPTGTLKADYQVEKTETSFFALTTDGVFQTETSFSGPFGQLLGSNIVFEADMSPQDQGLRISQAVISGDILRAAISGDILSGDVGRKLDLQGELVLSAPVTFQSVSVEEGAEASFEINGTHEAPELRLDARLGEVGLRDQSFESVRVRTELIDVLEAPKGPLQINANTQWGDLSAGAQFVSQPNSYAMSDLQISVGRLEAVGALALAQNGIVTGAVDLRLPEQEGQYAQVGIDFENIGNQQGLSFTADAKNIAYADFEIDKLSASAEGTFSALQGRVEAEGQRSKTLIARPFVLAAPFSVERDGPIYELKTPLQFRYGNIDVDTIEPLFLTYEEGAIKLQAPLRVGDGALDVEYSRARGEEVLALEARSLPVTLLPLPEVFSETRGRLSAQMNMQSRKGTDPSGDIVINLKDWRGFDAKKTTGLDAVVTASLEPGAVMTQLEASSTLGFTAGGDLSIPIKRAQSLAEIRPNQDAQLTGQLNAEGMAASIFGLVTPSEAQLGGKVNANVELSGTLNRPQINGRSSGQDLQFEVPELGTQVKGGRFGLNFTNNEFVVEDVFLTDSRDGRLSGQGAFKLAEFGRPIGQTEISVQNFRALDRRDIEAKVTGDLNFVSRQDDAELKGDITINRAEVKQFVGGTVSVIEIDAEEINKQTKEIRIEKPKARSPINLDVKINAPRRIYVRSRGVDVEMEIQADLKGTLTDPLFYGTADVIRGGYKIAGKTLDFESGQIKFDGELSKARIAFEAITQTQNLDALVNITGTVEDPKIELSSTPERPQDEILSALLFGRSATELSTIEAAQLAGALAQFSGAGGGFDLLGGLRDAFGIGQLSVNFNPDGSAQIVGGRYLAKDVYLQVFSGAGPDQTGAIVDWEIRKNIALRSRIRADNEQALSLKWKRDF
jgi:translocation and assembly module TamB